MIITLIIIYLVSVIGAWFIIRWDEINNNSIIRADWSQVFTTICPILNTFFILYVFIIMIIINRHKFPNWFFKIPKR